MPIADVRRAIRVDPTTLWHVGGRGGRAMTKIHSSSSAARKPATRTTIVRPAEDGGVTGATNGPRPGEIRRLCHRHTSCNGTLCTSKTQIFVIKRDLDSSAPTLVNAVSRVMCYGRYKCCIVPAVVVVVGVGRFY